MDYRPARATQTRRDFMAARTREIPRLVDGRRLETLLTFAAQASARQLIAAATQQVVDLLGERGSCVLVDGEPRVVLATAAPDLKNLPVNLKRYPEIRAALDSGNVVCVQDVRTDPLMEPVRELIPPQLGSVAVVPLIVGEHRLGVLMAQSHTKISPDAEEVATALLIGRMTALILESRLGKRIDLVLTGTQEVFIPDGTGVRTNGPASGAPAQEVDRRRVLLVEDNPERARAVMIALKNEGYDVVWSRDGADGVARALEMTPGLILLGVCLPGIDGLSAAEKLREDSRTREVPIIFMSGVDELLTRARGATFEKVEFLSHSHALPELLSLVDRFIRRSRPPG